VVRGRKNPLFFGLARRLQKARREAHLSFDSVAALAGMTDGSSVAHLERKEGHVPRLDTVERIAYGLGLSPGFLAYAIEGEARPPTKGLRCEGVAQRLADTRAARGLSVLAVGKLAGLSHTAVGNVERGTMPTLATAEALAKALDLSPAWLAYGIGPREIPARRKARTASAAESR
jgi:transcriptional regulator with XRE-family HTH domain